MPENRDIGLVLVLAAALCTLPGCQPVENPGANPISSAAGTGDCPALGTNMNLTGDCSGGKNFLGPTGQHETRWGTPY